MPCRMYPDDHVPKGMIPKATGDRLTRILCGIDDANETGDLAAYLENDPDWIAWRDKHRADDAKARRDELIYTALSKLTVGEVEALAEIGGGDALYLEAIRRHQAIAGNG